jgi:hypothetical protein
LIRPERFKFESLSNNVIPGLTRDPINLAYFMGLRVKPAMTEGLSSLVDAAHRAEWAYP